MLELSRRCAAIADISSPGTQNSRSRLYTFRVCAVGPDAALNDCTFAFDVKVG